MLGVDKGDHPALGLGLGCNVKGQRRFARRLGSVNLHDPSPGDAAYAKGHIQGKR